MGLIPNGGNHQVKHTPSDKPATVRAVLGWRAMQCHSTFTTTTTTTIMMMMMMMMTTTTTTTAVVAAAAAARERRRKKMPTKTSKDKD